MTLSIERADRRMGLASDRTVYSSKRNRPLLLYGRLLDDSRPSHGLTATNPDYFLFADQPAGILVTLPTRPLIRLLAVVAGSLSTRERGSSKVESHQSAGGRFVQSGVQLVDGSA